MTHKLRTANILLLFTGILSFGCFHASGKDPDLASLKRDLEAIIAPCNGTVGIAVMDLDGKDMVTVNDGRHYPMQSVYKFPQAIYELSLVDRQKKSLDDVYFIPKEQLDQKTWSPIVDSFPNQDVTMRLSDLLRYLVSKSDNNACDVLFKNTEGVRAVNQYIHGVGISDIAIVATEREMHANWQTQYTNWCRPSAMLQLLQLFYEGKLLSKSSNNFLMELMINSQNSANRIKALLPKGTVVAHKTGTSGTDKRGITAATNDVGIITLPDGRHLGIVVYVSDYTGGVATGERIIAQVAKCAWDHYTGKK